jgi:hypothetical protein
MEILHPKSVHHSIWAGIQSCTFFSEWYQNGIKPRHCGEVEILEPSTDINRGPEPTSRAEFAGTVRNPPRRWKGKGCPRVGFHRTQDLCLWLPCRDGFMVDLL